MEKVTLSCPLRFKNDVADLISQINTTQVDPLMWMQLISHFCPSAPGPTV